MLMYETERRRLTIARNLPQPDPRRRVAPRRHRGMKLAATFAAEDLSKFTPAIRTVA